MPLTQGAKVALGLGGAFVAYRMAFNRGKASQEAAMSADGSRRPAVDRFGREVRNWPGAAEYEGRVVEKASGAVLQKPSMGDRLSVAGTVVAEHSKGAVRDALSAASEVGEVVLEHSVEAVKDVGTTVKEVGQALVSREVPLQPKVHKTAPVTESTSRSSAPANAPDRAADVISTRAPAFSSHQGQTFNGAPAANQPKQQGESGYMQGVQAHAATVESARRKFEQHVSLPSDQASPSTPSPSGNNNQPSYNSSSDQQGMMSKASGAVASTVQHTKGAVKDAAQAVGEVGMIAATHTQGAASDVLQTAKETAQALAGQKPQVQVARTPDLVTNSSDNGSTPQPYKESVGAADPPSKSTSGADMGGAGAKGSTGTSMAEGRLRQMREDAKAEARAILAQGRQQSSPSSSSSPTQGQGQGQASSGGAGSNSPSLGERLSTAGQIIKEHATAAAQDMSQASQETSTVLKAHGELAKKDTQQAMAEVKGGVPPQGPQVRETPPLVEGTSKAKSQPVARQWSAEQLQQGNSPEQIKNTGK